MILSKFIFWMLDGVLAFVLGFVVWGSLIKPWIQNRIKRKLDPYLSAIFTQVDNGVIDRIQQGDREQLYQWLQNIVHNTTGGLENGVFSSSDEIREAARVVDSMYSPLANADNKKPPTSGGDSIVI